MADGVFDYILGRVWCPLGEADDRFKLLLDNDGLVSIRVGEEGQYTNFEPEEARTIAKQMLESASYVEDVNKHLRAIALDLRETYQSAPPSEWEQETRDEEEE